MGIKRNPMVEAFVEHALANAKIEHVTADEWFITHLRNFCRNRKLTLSPVEEAETRSLVQSIVGHFSPKEEAFCCIGLTEGMPRNGSVPDVIQYLRGVLERCAAKKLASEAKVTVI